MAERLTLTVDFTIGEKDGEDSYELGGTIKPEGAVEIIETWLRSQMGQGPDGRSPNQIQTYHIEIDWDPSDDSLVCRSDCGNKGLRDGLLLYVLNDLTEKEKRT